MKVEDFVNASINTLDNFDDFTGDATRLNPSVLNRNLNKSEVPDTIVDSVVSADEPVEKFAEIVETLLSLYEEEEEWVEVTDTQIASEIFFFRNSFIKGIVTEMNYTSYKKKCSDVAEVMDAQDIADADGCSTKHVERTMKVDARIVYTDGTEEDVQIKSSSSSRNSYVRNHIQEDKPSADVAVYPRNTGGWDRRTE